MPDVAAQAADEPEILPADPPAPARAPLLWPRRVRGGLAEAAVALTVAVVFMVWARNIDVDPLIRIGQVSGLATLQFRAALVAIPVLGAVLYGAHRAPAARYRWLLRLGCAAIAGLGTGMVAGGIAVALHGTPWGLGGQDGDPATLQAYAASFLRGEGIPDLYPPAFIVVLAEWAKYVRHGHVGFALQDLQLLLSAAFGPFCYLAWRTLLRPAWALAVALPAAILFLDPIRPYSHVVMVVLVPMLGRLLTELRLVSSRTVRVLALRGAGLGGVFGLLFLTYSGWFVWAGPGALVAIALLVPWRQGRRALGRSALLLGASAAVFVLVAAPSLIRMLLHRGTVDRYAYFDVYIDPAYVMGWRYDRAGWPASWAWPPPGELAGQGTFTILVLVGLGLALALGLRRLPVIAALACLGSAWVLRFWFAGHMQRDQAVMLYPRTTWLILYSLITLTVLAALLLSRGIGSLWRSLTVYQAMRVPRALGRRLAAGSLCALALFGAMAASWSANRYMPSDPSAGEMGMDAWRSHTLQRADGSCPTYAPGGKCSAPHQLWRPQDSKDVTLWCGNVSMAAWISYCGGKPPTG